MNIPPFTLVHRRPERGKNQAPAAGIKELTELARPLDALRPKFRQLKTSVLASIGGGDADQRSTAVETIQIISSELQRQKLVTTVGVWDLGARMGRLPALIKRLNEAQPTFVFFELEAGIPAGLISQPERIVRWAEDHLGEPLSTQDRADMTRNMIANDFFPRAETVRTEVGVDYLVGLTPSMVAEEYRGRVNWNHISTCQGRTVLASTQDLRLFARKAGRPFEALVGGVIVAQLFVAMFDPLEFHPEDRGCLFDYNESRESIIAAAKNPQIEPECLSRIPPRFRATALALVEVLKTYPAD